MPVSHFMNYHVWNASTLMTFNDLPGEQPIAPTWKIILAHADAERYNIDLPDRGNEGKRIRSQVYSM